MRCFALVTFLALAAGPAAADPKPAAKPTVAAKTDEAKPLCKRRVVGKGLDRKVVCEFEEPIVVGAEAPKPKVLIVPVSGRNVVGRPKQTDPFAGLSRRRTAD